jgi:dihydropteroate synthase
MTIGSQIACQWNASEPIIMGILNVTPDSFSDGGFFLEPQLAIGQALRMVDEGACIIDIGGESTRPGAEAISPDVQINRITPVIESLREHLPHGVLLSIDTSSAKVASAALRSGVGLVNDVSAGTADPDMFGLVASYNVPLVIMHMLGNPLTMQINPAYLDVVGEVLDYLMERARVAEGDGVKKFNIIIDPGIGFGKRKQDNLRLIADLKTFVDTGYPVLLGASRKRFMGSICNENTPSELLGATIATTVLGVASGVKIFRVHDVKANRQAIAVASAILNSRLL